jgi:hypothetical protein
MKGSGSGYGFDVVSEIGKSLEAAATARNKAEITMQSEKLKKYLARVEVVYE